jgi:hypothetical protein
MFEAKSYADLKKTFAAANVLFAVGWLALAYSFVLTAGHKKGLDDIFNAIKINPVWGAVGVVALVSAAWGFVTTYLIRLHDRLYEPHLVSWRAAYDTDYILRSLCAAYKQPVSQQFFERAFEDERARARFMQRLFYKFAGDNKSEHQELLELFYTTIQNYWLLVLAELYTLAFLLFSAVYCWLAGQTSPPYKTWTGVLVASLLLRVWSNKYLRKVRPITAEQVHIVLHEHFDKFNEALRDVLTEYNF